MAGKKEKQVRSKALKTFIQGNILLKSPFLTHSDVPSEMGLHV